MQILPLKHLRRESVPGPDLALGKDIPKGGFVAKKTYRKPTLRRLGLLRKMTRFSIPVE